MSAATTTLPATPPAALPLLGALTPPDLGWRQVDCDGVAVLSLRADLDVYAAGAFRGAFTRWCEASSGSGGVVLDLQRVPFVDSSGLGALVHAHRACRSHGRAMAIARAAPDVHALFDVTGIGRVIGVHPSVREAVTALAG